MLTQGSETVPLLDEESEECTLDMIRNSPLFWNVEILLWGAQLVYSGLLAFGFTVFAVILAGDHEGVLPGFICMAILSVLTLLWFLNSAVNIVLTFRKIHDEEKREQEREVRRRERRALQREYRRQLLEICTASDENQDNEWSVEVYTPGWHIPF